MAAPVKQFARRVLDSAIKNVANPTASQRPRFKFEVVRYTTSASTKPANRSLLCKSCRWNHNAQHKRTLFGLFKARHPAQPKPVIKDDLPYRVVLPGHLSAMRTVPDSVLKPEYANTGTASLIYRLPILLDEEEMKKMRESGAMARRILDIGASHIKPGVTTDFIDEMIHMACLENNVYPSTLNYKGYPKSVCTSVNNVMVHGIPDDRTLEDGDMVNVDFTVFMNGYHGDVSETYTVGSVDAAGQHLIDTARRCRDEAISLCGPYVPIAYIGIAIQKIAQAAGLYVCPSFVGHGIGKQFHCKPDIWHYANAYPEKMVPGMAFTIEPVIMERQDSFIIADDSWTILAEKHTRSAQFEHTVLITQTGIEVLTASPDEQFEMQPKYEEDSTSPSSPLSSSESHPEASSSTKEYVEPPGRKMDNKKDDWKFD